MHKILISLLALWALMGISFAATKKHHATKHSTKHVASSAKSKNSKQATSRQASSKHATSKRGTRAKARTKRSTTARARRTYQATPTPDRYKEIQQALASKGYYKGEANGVWRPDSVDALRRFQSDQNLDPDGKLGSLSLIALGLGPKRITAQAKPEPQAVVPDQANPPAQSKP